jgi:oligopeptide transport system ATP-binding protein
MPLLSVKDLEVTFSTDDGVVRAVNGLSFDIEPGKTLGIVGESGSGKSVTALSIMRLIAMPAGRIERGEIIFNGQDLLKLGEAQMRQIRGNKIAMIFQDPMTSLNPVLTVGDQIMETNMLHQHKSRAQAYKRAVEMLEMVRIPEPEKRIRSYPHQFSGGMRQRVMIAMALSCDPELLIADEPTTALDVTIQAQILDLMNDLQKRLNSAIIMITHDLGVVAEVCEKVLVMYAGNMVEYGTADQIFSDPKHPYTLGLLDSLPRLDEGGNRRLVPIEGQPPNLLRLPAGCAFAPRCPYALPDHAIIPPPVIDFGDGHVARCTLYNEEPGLDIRAQAERLKAASIAARQAALAAATPASAAPERGSGTMVNG